MTLEATRAAVDAAVIASEQEDEKTPATSTPKDAAAPVEGATPETPEAEKKGPEGEGDQPRFSSAKLRIRELVRDRNNIRAERDALSARLARYEQPLVKPSERENLDYDQRETLRIREATRVERKEELQDQIADAIEKEKSLVGMQLYETLSEANDPELKPFFEDINFPLNDDVIEFLAQSDQSVAIAKHLVQNRELAAKLHALTSGKTVTRAQLREFDRQMLGLEARLRAGVGVQPRKASQAPNPGTTLRGGSPPPEAKSLEEINDMDEYMKRRLPELNKRK